MRIRFLCLYFFWSSVSIADEISRNLLIDHYSFLNPSMGLGFEKENRNNQKAFAWYHATKEIKPKFDFHLQLMALSYKRILRENLHYTEIPYKLQKESGGLVTFNPGIRYYFFSLYGNFQKANPTYKGLSLGFHLYPEKSLFLFYKENPKENTKEYALSVLSGKSPGIGLSIAKEISSEKTEWSGSVSFSFQVESFTGAISHLPETESREDINSFFISKIFQENKESLFQEEINPYIDETDLEKEKKKEEWEAKKFKKKERIIHEIKIEELLKFRIPLVVAIRISRASKSKEEYEELLKTLSPDLVRKCNKIQYDKHKANR
jgi:hypothetical protein